MAACATLISATAACAALSRTRFSTIASAALTSSGVSVSTMPRAKSMRTSLRTFGARPIRCAKSPKWDLSKISDPPSSPPNEQRVAVLRGER